MKPFLFLAFPGVALMAYFGSQLGNRSGAGSGTVAAFAIGILLIMNGAIAMLAARIRRLEERLSSYQATKTQA